MDLFILEADTPKEMEDLAFQLAESKFIAIEKGDEFIVMKKRRYGNILIHAVSILLFLFVTEWFIVVNVAYFAYSYLWASPHVLITTEKKSEDGDDLKFNTMDEILKKANSIL